MAILHGSGVRGAQTGLCYERKARREMLWDQLLEHWRRRTNPSPQRGIPIETAAVLPPPRPRPWLRILLYGAAAVAFVALVGAVLAAVVQLLGAL